MMDNFYQLISRSAFFIFKIAVHLLAGLIFLMVYPFISGMDEWLEGY